MFDCYEYLLVLVVLYLFIYDLFVNLMFVNVDCVNCYLCEVNDWVYVIVIYVIFFSGKVLVVFNYN